jgi:hypothetical protein
MDIVGRYCYYSMQYNRTFTCFSHSLSSCMLCAKIRKMTSHLGGQQHINAPVAPQASGSRGPRCSGSQGGEVPGAPFLALMNLKVPYCLVRNALMRWKAPPLRRDCNRSKRFFLAWLAASNGWERTTWRDGRGEERRSLRDKEVKYI